VSQKANRNVLYFNNYLWRQRFSAICRWAVAQGQRIDDPASVVIDAALPRGDVKVRHLPALLQ